MNFLAVKFLEISTGLGVVALQRSDTSGDTNQDDSQFTPSYLFVSNQVKYYGIC